jgi:hypothetical protein
LEQCTHAAPRASDAGAFPGQGQAMEHQTRQTHPAAHIDRELPPDFAQRIATKVIFTNERERDPEAALEKIGDTLLRNLSRPTRVRHFIDVVEHLEDDPETLRFAGLCFVAIVLDRQENPRYVKFLDDIMNAVIEDHQREAKTPFQAEYRRRHFSAYARIMGDAFSAMMQINSELYEVVSQIFTMLIRKEMEQEQIRKDRAESSGRRISVAMDEGAPKVGKKLFDDLVDYVHDRGEQRTGTLQQQNPNEFIAILADRLRGTRRYVIQDILNQQALERRKEAEKELSERLAGAEEIILAKDAYKRSIRLYWTEKQYNFKYMAVEKVRVTVQVLAVIVGILHFLLGYLGLLGMHWWEGVIATVAMYLFARVFGSRAYFRRFFPDDVTKELEVVVGSFTPTFRKMGKDQLDAFMHRQVRDPENLHYLALMPEFVRYVFAVMPDRNNVVIEREDLGEILQNMEMDIARVLRTTSPSMLSFP